MIIDNNWVSAKVDTGKFKELVQGTITEITAEDLKGVTQLVESAFENQKQLVYAELPDTIKTINRYAFYNCSNLSQVELPDTFTTLGSGMFQSCSKLTTFRVPHNVKSISSYCFQQSGLKTIDWGEDPQVETISDSAFSSCPLTSITIPESVKYIGSSAFSGALKNVTEFYLPESLVKVLTSSSSTTITNTAFATLYENLYYLPSKTNQYFLADKKASNLETQIIHKDCEIIGGALYWGSTVLKNIVFEEGSQLRTISDYAFYQCTGLETVTLPETVNYLGDSVFASCTNLTTLNIQNVTHFDSSVLKSCTKLSSLVLSKNIEYIGPSVFEGCSGITEFEVNENLKFLGRSAFSGAKNLTKIIINAKPEELTGGAFGNLTALTELYWNTEPWEGYTSDYLWYSKNTEINLIVGDAVNVFSTRSFGYAGSSSYMNITTATFGSNIKEIQGTWLYQNALTEITLKTSEPPILEETFRDSLQTIYIPMGSLEAYSTATNWSKYVDKFVEKDM